MVKPTISFSDFSKLDLRVGKVLVAVAVPGSEKLLQLTVFFGDELGTKIIYAGIKPWYAPESLVGRKLAFVVNLESKKFVINGVALESQGMLLAAGDEFVALYNFDKDLPPGATVH